MKTGYLNSSMILQQYDARSNLPLKLLMVSLAPEGCRAKFNLARQTHATSLVELLRYGHSP